MINLECSLEWEKPLYEDSNWHIFGGRVVHVAVDDRAISPEPITRIENMKLIYNVRSTVNPLNGEYYGPASLGLLSEVVKVFEDNENLNGIGRVSAWRKGHDNGVLAQ